MIEVIRAKPKHLRPCRRRWGGSRWFVGVLALAVTLVASGTSASADVPPKQAAAAALRKGRKLMAAGKVREACDAFEDSQRLDPQPATLFTLGNCQERIGRISSAWLAYRDVASRDIDKARRRKATELAAKLGARVPKLLLRTEHEIVGLAVTLAGPAGSDSIKDAPRDVTDRVGVDIPVDPGAYSITATASGYKSVTREVKVVADGKVTSVPLTLDTDDAGSPTPDAPKTADTSSTSDTTKRIVIPTRHDDEPRDRPPVTTSHRRTYAAIMVAAGTLGIATSVGFGISARSKYNSARNLCGASDTCPDATTLEQANHDVSVAQKRGNLATIIGAASGAALVGGLILWATAPHDVAVSASASASSAGVTVSGRF